MVQDISKSIDACAAHYGDELYGLMMMEISILKSLRLIPNMGFIFLRALLAPLSWRI